MKFSTGTFITVAWIVLSACIADPTVRCDDSVSCAAGTLCVALAPIDVSNTSVFVCASDQQLAACVDIEQGSKCIAVSGRAGTCLSAQRVCIEDICGDYALGSTERCDDGNPTDGDGCSRDCQSNETCGNNIIDGVKGEECDVGPFGLSGDGCTSGCKAEALQWLDRNPKEIPATSGHRMVYDIRRKVTVLFGGINDELSNQTWEFDGQVWTPRTFPEPPSARTGHQLAYDSDRNVTILFGGSENTQLLNDTWEYDGVSWTKLSPATAPTPRAQHAMAYDSAAKRVVIFGGATIDNDVRRNLNETWAFNGTTWAQVVTATQPIARIQSAMAYDSFRDRMVLFGGRDRTGRFSDTWELNGATWTKMIVSVIPTKCSDQAMIFDSGANVMVMFGGVDDERDSPPVIPLHDLWVYDGTSWQVRPQTVTAPAGRFGHSIVFDTTHQVSVLFGGSISTNSPVNDTWVLPNPLSPQANWTEPTFEQPNVIDAALVFDNIRGKAVLFGGRETDNGILNLSWEYDGRVWRQLPEATTDPKRTRHAMTFDPKRGVVMFGGGTSRFAGQSSNETWIFNDAHWTLQTPTLSPSPSPRADHGMVFDDHRRKTVLFGGELKPVDLTRVFDAETWEFDGDWKKIATVGAPTPRSGHAMAYDARRKKTVLFGGSSDGDRGGARGDTWEFDDESATWTKIDFATDAPKPSARFGAAMTFDYKRGVILLFGGETENGLSRESWEFDGTNWSPQAPLNAPLRSESSLMTYDTTTNTPLLLTGTLTRTPTSVKFANDLRSYTFRSEAPTEQCVAEKDFDGDKLFACDDPDCFGRCFPQCSAQYSVGAACSRTSGSRCGDGECNPALEDYLLCPMDCQRR
jgi:cysteine-rich repeat protein